MNKVIFGYFSKGFSLTNKSLDIFLISLFFLLFGQLSYLFQDSLIRNTLEIISLIFIFFSSGFHMSIPLFLLTKQQNKSLEYQMVWSVLIRNTKRMIIPTILFFVLIIGVFLFLLFLAVIFTRPADDQQFVNLLKSFVSYLSGWNLIFVIFGAIASFFVFTPIYFSVENNGFFSSLKKSATLAFRNLNYILIIILIFTISYSITALIPVSSDNIIVNLVRISITQYIALLVTASTLYYYQDH